MFVHTSHWLVCSSRTVFFISCVTAFMYTYWKTPNVCISNVIFFFLQKNCRKTAQLPLHRCEIGIHRVPSHENSSLEQSETKNQKWNQYKAHMRLSS